MIGKAAPERTTNFGWPAVQQVSDFLSWSFLFLLIFSSFSNNAARHDLPNRQSVNSWLVSRSISLERLGNMGFTTIFLRSNVKNSLVTQLFMQ